jgi:hypothetical protein
MRSEVNADRTRHATREAQLDAAEERMELFPHRRKYQALVIRHLRALLDLHTGLIDEVESDFSPTQEGPVGSDPLRVAD